MLAITVIGISTALFLGAPVITQMQERAALENVVGQFEEVRAAGNDMFLPDEARYPTLSIPSGQLALRPGTHVLVTTVREPAGPACDFRVTDWEGWDAILEVNVHSGTTDCVAVTPTSSASCGAGACFHAARYDGDTATALTWTRTAATSTTYTLGTALAQDADYRFWLTSGNPAPNDVLAEAWLLHMDQLAWSAENVQAIYEGGAVFTHEVDYYYLASGPAVSESPNEDPYFLRFTTLQDSVYRQLIGSDSHTVGLVLTDRHVRIDYDRVQGLRLDVHGSLAEAWCNAFLLRDSLASLGGDHYRSDEGAHSCRTDQPDADQVRSVRYIEGNPPSLLDPQPFYFTLTQTSIHASIDL